MLVLSILTAARAVWMVSTTSLVRLAPQVRGARAVLLAVGLRLEFVNVMPTLNASLRSASAVNRHYQFSGSSGDVVRVLVSLRLSLVFRMIFFRSFTAPLAVLLLLSGARRPQDLTPLVRPPICSR